MSEAFILGYIEVKLKQLGYQKYHIRYRDITIKGSSKIKLQAFNELYFIIDDPQGVVMESDYGIFDTTGEYLSDNAHMHKGEIEIVNPGEESKRIKFIQVIIIS